MAMSIAGENQREEGAQGGIAEQQAECLLTDGQAGAGLKHGVVKGILVYHRIIEPENILSWKEHFLSRMWRRLSFQLEVNSNTLIDLHYQE